MSWWRRGLERARGVLLIAVAVGAGIALYEQTPLGPLGRMAVNLARGRSDAGPSPLAAFRDAGGRSYGFLVPADERAIASVTAARACLPRDQVEQVARAQEVDPAGVAAVLGAHAEEAASGCRLHLPAGLERRLVEVLPAGTTREVVRADPLLAARGISRLLANELRAFKGEPRAPDLALEALLLGHEPVADAVAAARAAGIDDPGHLESHRGLLPTGAADRADRALWVLARTRLGKMRWPAARSFRITSPFGDRMHPVLGVKRFHNGVDLAMPVGTPLQAILDGQVSRVGYDNVSGHYVRIDHDYGIEAVYCHLSPPSAREGYGVAQSDEVARSGNSGRSTGPHLHFTLRLFGRPVDPVELFGGEIGAPAVALAAAARAHSGG